MVGSVICASREESGVVRADSLVSDEDRPRGVAFASHPNCAAEIVRGCSRLAGTIGGVGTRVPLGLAVGDGLAGIS